MAALRFGRPPTESCKELESISSGQSEDPAYRPAYEKPPHQLARLVDSWHRPPEPLRRAIVAILDAAEGSPHTPAAPEGSE